MSEWGNTNDQTELYMKVLISIHKMESFLRTAENTVLKKYQITPMQLGVLDTLSQKGELMIQTLIDEMASTSGNMTVVIRNLDKAGYIYRKSDPSDKRRCVIGLTESGRMKLEEIMPEHMRNVADVLETMPDERKRMLIEIIDSYLA
ncbi:MAG: MarR family transcriptional regulator [Lachnospiraceae bacterium]|nr:MarR family transcriptional regulator [Lachnospiraceae bacterium]